MNELLLDMLDEFGDKVLKLTELHSREDFFASPEICRQTIEELRAMVGAAESIPLALKKALSEVEWVAWEDLGHKLWAGHVDRDAVWSAVETLVPDTLLWLRLYRMAKLGGIRNH